MLDTVPWNKPPQPAKCLLLHSSGRKRHSLAASLGLFPIGTDLLKDRERTLPRLGTFSLQREGLSCCQPLGSFHGVACLTSIGPQAQGLLLSDLFVWGCASPTLGFPITWPQKVKTSILCFLPDSFPEHLASSPPAPNHCSFLPQVYRPRKQPPCSNIPCTCDAGYSPDFTAKYHGSSYDAYMSQRSQVSQLLRKHTPLRGVGVQKYLLS